MNIPALRHPDARIYTNASGISNVSISPYISAKRGALGLRHLAKTGLVPGSGQAVFGGRPGLPRKLLAHRQGLVGRAGGAGKVLIEG